LPVNGIFGKHQFMVVPNILLSSLIIIGGLPLLIGFAIDEIYLINTKVFVENQNDLV
jgi:hypothetical protein